MFYVHLTNHSHGPAQPDVPIETHIGRTHSSLLDSVFTISLSRRGLILSLVVLTISFIFRSQVKAVLPIISPLRIQVRASTTASVSGMQFKYRPSEKRGNADHGWLKVCRQSYHTCVDGDSHSIRSALQITMIQHTRILGACESSTKTESQ